MSAYHKLYLSIVLALCFAPVVRAADEAFDFEVLQFRAKNLAAEPYKPKTVNVPTWLQKYTYDQYREIRFDPTHAVWKREGLPFQLQFFHPGRTFTQTVQINELDGKKVQRIDFSTKMFNYGANKAGKIPADLGFAGFRIHYALNNPKYLDELAAFLGASYFRALGKGQYYGLSARGLAVNTIDSGGEEFPVFEEFWIERPAADAKSITVYALMDSTSLTGAYKFIITPGNDTVMRVHAAVYCRKNPKMFGIAPLTSMFLHGENTGWARDDYRPEVHDSDGLLIEAGSGEWIWRPLTNPKSVTTAAFTDQSPHGFGLLQRDRQFEHYDDLEAYYHERPSVWVEPIVKWGPGAVSSNNRIAHRVRLQFALDERFRSPSPGRICFVNPAGKCDEPPRIAPLCARVRWTLSSRTGGRPGDRGGGDGWNRCDAGKSYGRAEEQVYRRVARCF